MKRKSLIYSFVFICLFLVPLSFSVLDVGECKQLETLDLLDEESQFLEADGEAWLSGYNYRKKHTIIAVAGAGTNYPIEFHLEYGAGVDTGNTAYFNSECQTDFDDIRFTDNDGSTELDYWREEYTVSDDATFWVEIADSLSTSNVVIYLYYGNVGVSTTSSGTDTFLFFDDFENNNLNRWTIAEGNWATTSGQKKRGSYSAFGDADASGRNLYYDFSSSLTTDFMAHMWIRFEVYNVNEYPMYFKESNGDELYALGSTADDWSTYNGVTWLTYETGQEAADTWYEAEVGFDFTNTLFRCWRDGVEKSNRPLIDGSGGSVVNTDKVGTITSTASGWDTWVDDFYIRKWQVAEPTHGDWDCAVPWFNGNWEFRKAYYINGQAGAGTNYQIRLDVNFGDGSDSGSSVYLGEECQTDFDDIRFTVADGTTELDYWCEEYIAGVDATFWVEVTDNLDSGRLIYLYYGNSLVSTTSNGTNTFQFFDDFNDASLDTSKWNEWLAYGSYSESGGILQVTGGNNAWECVGSRTQWTHGIAIEYYAKHDESQYTAIGYDERTLDGSYIGNLEEGKIYNDGDMWWRHRDNTSARVDDARTSSISSWTRVSMHLVSSSDVEIYFDDVLKKTLGSSANDDAVGIDFEAKGTSNDVYVDWIAARKVCETEPTGSFGEEEQFEVSWLEGWNYRQSYSFYWTAIRDYHVNKFTVHKGIGESSLTDIYTNYECQDNFGDIRFTSNVDGLELNYWISDMTSGVEADFLVRIPDGTGAGAVLTVYYGIDTKEDAKVTTSDLSSICDLYDNFDDGSVNTTLWNQETENGNVYESGGKLRIDSEWIDPTAYPAIVMSKDTFDVGTIFSFRAEVYLSTGLEWGLHQNTTPAQYILLTDDMDDIETRKTSIWNYYADPTTYGNRRWDFMWNATDVLVYDEENLEAHLEDDTYIPDEPLHIYWRSGSNGLASIDIAWVSAYYDSDFAGVTEEGTWSGVELEVVDVDYSTFTYNQIHEVIGMDTAGPKDLLAFDIYYETDYSRDADVYLNGEVQNDFDDIRFVRVDTSTMDELPLDYWLAKYESGVSARVFVEMVGVEETEILKMYYGNSTVGGFSHPERMEFVVFEDFSVPLGDAWDLTEYSGDNNHSMEYANGYLHISVDSEYDKVGYMWTMDNVMGGPYVVETYGYFDSYTGSGWCNGLLLGYCLKDNYDDEFGMRAVEYGGYHYESWEDGNLTFIDRDWIVSDTLYSRFTVDSSGNFDMFIESEEEEDVESYSDTQTSILILSELTFGTWAEGSVGTERAISFDTYLDYIVVAGQQARHGEWSVQQLADGSLDDDGRLPELFKYRQRHTIEAAYLAGSNNNIRFDVFAGTGTSNGNNIYLQNDAQADFDDIRFTDENGTLLSHFNEKEGATDSSTIIWVNIPNDLSSDDFDIYVYWGNNDILSASDGYRVFDFFEDFSESYANATWYNNSMVTISNGFAYIPITSTFMTVPSVNWSIDGSNKYIFGYRGNYQYDSIRLGSFGLYTGDPYHYIMVNNHDGVMTIKVPLDESNGNITDSTDVFSSYMLKLNLNLAIFEKDYGAVQSYISLADDGVNITDGRLRFTNGPYLDSAYPFVIDWVYAHDWNLGTPVHGSWYSKENLSPADGPDRFVDVKFAYDAAALTMFGIWGYNSTTFFKSLLEDVNDYVDEFIFDTDGGEGDLGSLTFYNPVLDDELDEDWVVYDSGGVHVANRTTYTDWLDGWAWELGWHERGVGRSSGTLDAFWHMDRFDDTDPANDYEFDWGTIPYEPNIYDITTGVAKQGATDWWHAMTGMDSDADGLHGERMDLLVMFTMSNLTDGLSEVLGVTATASDYIIINLQVIGSIQAPGWAHCYNPLTHGINFPISSSHVPGVSSTLVHELGHVFGIKGPEKLDWVTPYPDWSENGYTPPTLPYEGWLLILAHGLTDDIMDYFDYACNNDIPFNPVGLNSGHRAIWVHNLGLHSEYRPLLRWGYNYASSSFGWYIAGNKYTFILRPI
jgi:hypothetical protein